MELRNIKTFVKITEYKSFSKAANALGYTQSAVTIQIKQLEEELKVILFDRIGKKIFLTQKGEDFLSYAVKILNLTDQAIHSMDDEKIPSGELRIGVTESLCTSVFTEIIQNCTTSFPDIELIVEIGTTPELISMLNKNIVDLILTLDRPFIDKNYIVAYEKNASICFISNPEHKFANKNLKLKELLNETYILPEKVCKCRKELNEKISKYRNPSKIKVFLEIGNTEIIKKFVSEGLGISLLPDVTIEKELKTGKLTKINVEDIDFNITLQLAYHKNKHKTVTMDTIISLVKASFG